VDLLEVDGGNVTIRLYTDHLQALALACHLAGYGSIDRLAPDRPAQEARAHLYQALACLFESLAGSSVAHEGIPDYLRPSATPQAIRRGWIAQGRTPDDMAPPDPAA
jgi:hypothetical protein